MQKNIDLLIQIAKHKMAHSHDPIHDLDHVKRVVNYTKLLSQDFNLNQTQKQALVLAAWWHDVSRTVNKKSSFILMTLIDDMVSAIMLWFFTIRCGLFGTVAGMSAKLILCKSLGAGAVFTKILLRKKNRIMVDIIKDADMLDILAVNRMERLILLVEESKKYYFGYKILCWWLITRSKLQMKTQAAIKYLEEILRQFMQWINSEEIKNFFIETFGIKWSKKMLKGINELLDSTSLLELQMEIK